jgi:hypothetical protein
MTSWIYSQLGKKYESLAIPFFSFKGKHPAPDKPIEQILIILGVLFTFLK